MNGPNPVRREPSQAGLVAGAFGAGLLLALAAWVFVGVDPLRVFGRRTRSTVGEVRANLKAAYTSQKAYFAEKDTYVADYAQVGFVPERDNRYAYFLANAGPTQPRATEAASPMPAGGVIVAVDTHRHPRGFVPPRFADTRCPLTPMEDPKGRRLAAPGLTPGPQGGFLLAAAGNVDDDPELDCWSIASEHRVAADGTGIEAGVPYNERNDLR